MRKIFHNDSFAIFRLFFTAVHFLSFVKVKVLCQIIADYFVASSKTVIKAQKSVKFHLFVFFPLQ